MVGRGFSYHASKHCLALAVVSGPLASLPLNITVLAYLVAAMYASQTLLDIHVTPLLEILAMQAITVRGKTHSTKKGVRANPLEPPLPTGLQ